MEFNKDCVFTAVNADELHKGDKVIVADCLDSLRKDVELNEGVCELKEVLGENIGHRFSLGEASFYALAYLMERKENCTNCSARWVCPVSIPNKNPKLTKCNAYEPLEPKIEPKAEKHYRPFKDTDELIKVWNKKFYLDFKPSHDPLTMPLIWVRGKISKNTNTGWLVTGIGYDGVALGDTSLSWEELFEDWEFLDGSPCGVEE